MSDLPLSPDSAAAVLGMSAEHLCRLRASGDGPAATHVGARSYYTERALIEWSQTTFGDGDPAVAPSVLAAAKSLFARNHGDLPWESADDDDRNWYIQEAIEALSAAAAAGWQPSAA